MRVGIVMVCVSTSPCGGEPRRIEESAFATVVRQKIACNVLDVEFQIVVGLECRDARRTFEIVVIVAEFDNRMQNDMVLLGLLQKSMFS